MIHRLSDVVTKTTKEDHGDDSEHERRDRLELVWRSPDGGGAFVVLITQLLLRNAKRSFFQPTSAPVPIAQHGFPDARAGR